MWIRFSQKTRETMNTVIEDRSDSCMFISDFHRSELLQATTSFWCRWYNSARCRMLMTAWSFNGFCWWVRVVNEQKTDDVFEELSENVIFHLCPDRHLCGVKVKCRRSRLVHNTPSTTKHSQRLQKYHTRAVEFFFWQNQNQKGVLFALEQSIGFHPSLATTQSGTARDAWNVDNNLDICRRSGQSLSCWSSKFGVQRLIVTGSEFHQQLEDLTSYTLTSMQGDLGTSCIPSSRILMR